MDMLVQIIAPMTALAVKLASPATNDFYLLNPSIAEATWLPQSVLSFPVTTIPQKADTTDTVHNGASDGPKMIG